MYWASLAVLGYLPYVTQPSTIYDAYFLNVNNGKNKCSPGIDDQKERLGRREVCEINT